MSSSSSSKMPQIYLAVGVLVAAGAFLYTQRKKDKATTNTTYTQGAKTGNAPQFKIVPTEIDKFTFKAKDKPEVVVEKKGSDWSMVSPIAGAKIQKGTIDDMLKSLSSISFKDFIAKGSSVYPEYELNDGKAIHLVASKGGSVVIDLWLGAQKSRGQLARVNNSEEVWSVAGISSWTFDKAPKDVREKRVWDITRDQIVSIDLTSPKGAFSFTRSVTTAAPAPTADASVSSSPSTTATPWVGLFNNKPIEKFDPAKVDDLLSAYALGGVLNAEDFGDGKSDAETGLTSPEAASLVFKMKDGAVHKITVGKTELNYRRFAKREGDPTIYVLGDNPSNWSQADTSKFVATPAGDAGVREGGTPVPAMPKTMMPPPSMQHDMHGH